MSNKNYTAVFLCIVMFYVFGDLYLATKLAVVKMIEQHKIEQEREERHKFELEHPDIFKPVTDYNPEIDSLEKELYKQIK
jgi:hypothetical protein